MVSSILASRRVLSVVAFFSLASLAAAQAPPAGPAPASQPRPGQALEALLADKVDDITPGMTLEQITKKGLEALDKKLYASARRILEAVAREEPGNPMVLTGLAAAYEAQYFQLKDSQEPGDRERAQNLMKAAYGWFVTAAPRLLEMGDAIGAERAYLRALALPAKSAAAHLGLARAYAAMGRDLNAIEQYRAYLGPLTGLGPSPRLEDLNLPPDSVTQANIELAQAYRRTRSPAMALDRLIAAQKNDPESAAIFYELARSYQDSSNFEKAFSNINEALKRANGNPEYHNERAKILMARRDTEGARGSAEEAIRLAIEALKIKPDNQAVLAALSQYYTTYQQVLRARLGTPNSDVNDRIALASAIQRQGSVSQALNLYQSIDVLRKAPPSQRDNVALLELLADAQDRLAQVDAAVATARHLNEVQPGNAIARRILNQYGSQATQASP